MGLARAATAGSRREGMQPGPARRASMRIREYAGTARAALAMVEDLSQLALLELREELNARVRYVAALAAAALLGVIALFYVGIVVIVLAWETDYRIATALAVLIVPLVAAAIIAWMALRRWRDDRWLTATREESREFYLWLKTKL
jgi:uncharacterized membrane protein YqjE